LSSLHDQPPLGLRERKKAKTRAAIQSHALRLFAAQGYDATTVDEIVEAAEVSQSTFFRYFPTKEDVVLHDRYDPLMLDAFAAQPAELSPIEALRGAMRSVLGSLPADEREQERHRGALVFSVPELRARALDQIAGTMQMLNDALAKRLGRPPDDVAVRTMTGALIGVAISTLVAVGEDPSVDYFELIDTALGQLEGWIPL
jgi:AcrR family transcriptional regulator